MIYDIIEKLENTSSTNGKIEILKENKDNELLQKVLFYAYNPLFNYYTKYQVNPEINYGNSGQEELGSIFHFLDKLINREITGGLSTTMLDEVALSIPKNDRIILNRIVARDMRCGISAKTINKVWKDLIPTIPYMRCSLLDKVDRIKYPAIVQRKADGLFCNAVVRNGKVKFFTRNGTEFSLVKLADVVERFVKYADVYNEGIVLNGELLATDDDGNELSRKEGNGLINSLIKKEQTLESLREKVKEAKTLRSAAKFNHEIEAKLVEYDNTDVSLKYVVWDEIDYNAWIKGEMNLSYATRLAHLKVSMQNMEPLGCFQLIETKEVNSLEEAQEFYKEQISLGYEGAILKNKSGVWKNHTSPDQIKLKAEKECDLVVVGYDEGSGKYEGKIGSLVCESMDGLLRVNVGSGLTDADREESIEKYFGKVVAVKYNEVIDSESKNTFSLFLPRFVEIRNDKTEADDFETIKKI